ncbi:MAG: hypothetical protein Q4P13_09585 [Psychrobacter sp.]|nr:hypothetical protein [Psychrobacter sp.]
MSFTYHKPPTRIKPQNHTVAEEWLKENQPSECINTNLFCNHYNKSHKQKYLEQSMHKLASQKDLMLISRGHYTNGKHTSSNKILWDFGLALKENDGLISLDEFINSTGYKRISVINRVSSFVNTKKLIKVMDGQRITHYKLADGIKVKMVDFKK